VQTILYSAHYVHNILYNAQFRSLHKAQHTIRWYTLYASSHYTHHLNSQVVLLQSTASVYRGHSGGMLVDCTGRFLGLVTSNAKHATGQIIPTLNFSIPSSVLHALVAHAAQAQKGEVSAVGVW
jgi:S1-C subfamily serine protease